MMAANSPCFLTSTPSPIKASVHSSSLFAPTLTCGTTTSRLTPTRKHRCERVSIVASQTGTVDDNLVWVDAIPLEENEPGKTKRTIVANLDICLACAFDGQVYAVGNKSPPLGLPTSDGVIVDVENEPYIKCAQYGTLFNLSTGDVKDTKSWIPTPAIVSNFLRFIFRDPQGVPTYPVREQNGMLQVLVNVNAREQYEKKYWKGVLDASGKADGSYY